MRSKSFTDKTDQVAEYFGTHYSVEPFSDELVTKMKKPAPVITDAKLDLPVPNTLIPTNFDLLPADTSLSKEPVQLKRWDSGILWYMKDDTFKKPKASISLQLHTSDNNFGVTKEARIFASIWKEMVDEYLNEFKYQAELANLNFSVSVHHDLLMFDWGGFNDSMPNFLTETIEKIVEMRSADMRKEFDAVKEKKMLEWKNMDLQQSYRQMMQVIGIALTDY